MPARAAYHFDEQVEEVAARHVLHHQIQILLVLERIIQTHNGRRVRRRREDVALRAHMAWAPTPAAPPVSNKRRGVCVCV
jgi:hypothetical protein